MTDAEFHYALSRLRSGTAAGDDGVYTEMGTHLGPVGSQWLRKLLSRSLSSGIVPGAWRRSNIVPIPKPGNDTTKAASYRPIALTSVIAKLAERVVATRLSHLLEPTLSPSQSGFRPERTTLDPVSLLVDRVLEGFNHYMDHADPRRNRLPDSTTLVKRFERTLSVLVDFTAAFDRVDRNLLIRKLLDKGVPRASSAG